MDRIGPFPVGLLGVRPMELIAHALSFVGALSSAATAEETKSALDQALKPFGVRFFLVGMASNIARGGVESVWVAAWPSDWMRDYVAEGKIEYDPVAAAVVKGQSFRWSDLKVSDPRAKKLMADAAAIGMGEGYCFIDASRGWPRPFMTVSGERLDWSPAEQGVVGYLGHLAWARMMLLQAGGKAPETTRLSFREASALRHAALGRNDKVTARLMNLSPETVRVHWRSIRKKLRAADRAHAVAIGIWTGEISP